MITPNDFANAEAMGSISFSFSALVQSELRYLRETKMIAAPLEVILPNSNTLTVLAALTARAMSLPDCRLDTCTIQAAAEGRLMLTQDEQALAAIVLAQWHGKTLNPVSDVTPRE